MDYTFAQPVRGGYYYIVARAESIEEATALAEDAMKNIEHKESRDSTFGMPHPGGLAKMNEYTAGTLVLPRHMEERLKTSGVAHIFKKTWLSPFPERMGYKARLP